MNRELVRVDNWLKTNRLSLNVSKSSYLIICNQKNASDIKLRDSILTKISTVKLLGVTFDENLTFNAHVIKIQGSMTKIFKYVGVMRRLHSQFDADLIVD